MFIKNECDFINYHHVFCLFKIKQMKTLVQNIFSNGDQDWLVNNKDENYWLVDVIKNANKIIRSDRNAKYWFKEFCHSTSDEFALIAFKLFLKCTDRRCWTWISNELKGLDEGNIRLLHYQLNVNEIANATVKNEKEFKKTFLDKKLKTICTLGFIKFEENTQQPERLVMELLLKLKFICHIGNGPVV